MSTEIKKKDKSDEQWQKYLNTSWNNMAKHTMEFAKRMHEFRESRAEHGDYVKLAEEWYGINKDAASDWSLIGKQYALLVKEGRNLPASRTALKKLSLLSSKDINVLEEREMFTPKLSGAMVDTFVTEMKVLETSDALPIEEIEEEDPIEGEYEELEQPPEKIPAATKETEKTSKPKEKAEPVYTVEDAYEALQGVPFTREVLLLLKNNAIKQAESEEDQRVEDYKLKEIDKAVAKILEAQFN